MELTDSLDDLKARIQSDLLALTTDTYTHIDWNDPSSAANGPYPVFDPSWLPDWMSQLPEDLSTDTVTFLWLY